MRILALLFAAAVAKLLGDLGLGSAGLHRALRLVSPLSLVVAAYLVLHPLVIRSLFARSRTGIAVEVRWAGRHRSGQSWLVLHAIDGRVWRVLPRRGPATYPLPRWGGTPWLEPPPPSTGPIRGTFLQPAGTWRRGLILHRSGSMASGVPATAGDGDDDVLPLGAGAPACIGVHLKSIRRLPDGPGHARSHSPSRARREPVGA